MGIEPARRLDELDSLRGLAALSVVLFHFENNWPAVALPGLADSCKIILALLLKPFTAGTEAVLLFFILSGFVLSIPAIELRAQSYPVFVVRRIFRIYLPYLASLVLAVGGTAWYFWPAPVDWPLVVQHVLLLGQFDSNRYNNPVWTLVYEMRISLVFPFLCAMTLKLRPARSLLAAIGIYAAARATWHLIPSLAGGKIVCYSMHIALLFMVGIYLARERERISKRFNRLSRRMKIGLAILSALFYFYGGTLWLYIVHSVTSNQSTSLADLFTAAGASGILVFSLNSRWCKRFLLWAPVHNLGKMSYSLYLLHYPIIVYLESFLYGKLPLPAILAICLGVSLLAAWVFYRLIEAPSMKWGRKLSQLIQPPRASTG